MNKTILATLCLTLLSSLAQATATRAVPVHNPVSYGGTAFTSSGGAAYSIRVHMPRHFGSGSGLITGAPISSGRGRAAAGSLVVDRAANKVYLVRDDARRYISTGEELATLKAELGQPRLHTATKQELALPESH